MSFSLLPTVRCEALTDLSPEILKERGIELLMLDFDNTIVPYTTNTPDADMEQWLQSMLISFSVDMMRLQLPRMISHTSGFFLCGIMLDPVVRASGNFMNP